MKIKCMRLKSKKGVSLIELVVTIALLSIFATVSTAIVWIVMQTFQSSTDMSLNSQQISMVQKMLHSSAEVAQNIEVIEDLTGPNTALVQNSAKGDRLLMLKEVNGVRKLCLYECVVASPTPSSPGTWEEFVPFDGIKTAKLELIESSTTGQQYRFTYTFTSEKDFAYSGGAEVNNMETGTPFNDNPGTLEHAVHYDASTPSHIMICFRM